MVSKNKEKKNNLKKNKKVFDILFYTVSEIVILVLLFIGLRQRGLLPLWIDNLPSSRVKEISEDVVEKRNNFDIINKWCCIINRII